MASILDHDQVARRFGFNGRSAPVASSRLIDAVAASLVLGAFSLCLVVGITVLSIKVSVAMPIVGKLETGEIGLSRRGT